MQWYDVVLMFQRGKKKEIERRMDESTDSVVTSVLDIVSVAERVKKNQSLTFHSWTPAREKRSVTLGTGKDREREKEEEDQENRVS